MYKHTAFYGIIRSHVTLIALFFLYGVIMNIRVMRFSVLYYSVLIVDFIGALWIFFHALFPDSRYQNVFFIRNVVVDNVLLSNWKFFCLAQL
jgi:hypothetical protein